MGRAYFPHIYFEAARPRGCDSVTQAIHELGKYPGVTLFEEHKRVALAQLADYVDGWTVNHCCEIIPFTV